jgi:hypothetical protein
MKIRVIFVNTTVAVVLLACTLFLIGKVLVRIEVARVLGKVGLAESWFFPQPGAVAEEVSFVQRSCPAVHALLPEVRLEGLGLRSGGSLEFAHTRIVRPSFTFDWCADVSTAPLPPESTEKALRFPCSGRVRIDGGVVQRAFPLPSYGSATLEDLSAELNCSQPLSAREISGIARIRSGKPIPFRIASLTLESPRTVRVERLEFELQHGRVVFHGRVHPDRGSFDGMISAEWSGEHLKQLASSVLGDQLLGRVFAGLIGDGMITFQGGVGRFDTEAATEFRSLSVSSQAGLSVLNARILTAHQQGRLRLEILDYSVPALLDGGVTPSSPRGQISGSITFSLPVSTAHPAHARYSSASGLFALRGVKILRPTDSGAIEVARIEDGDLGFEIGAGYLSLSSPKLEIVSGGARGLVKEFAVQVFQGRVMALSGWGNLWNANLSSAFDAGHGSGLFRVINPDPAAVLSAVLGSHSAPTVRTEESRVDLILTPSVEHGKHILPTPQAIFQSPAGTLTNIDPAARIVDRDCVRGLGPEGRALVESSGATVITYRDLVLGAATERGRGVAATFSFGSLTFNGRFEQTGTGGWVGSGRGGRRRQQEDPRGVVRDALLPVIALVLWRQLE